MSGHDFFLRAGRVAAATTLKWAGSKLTHALGRRRSAGRASFPCPPPSPSTPLLLTVRSCRPLDVFWPLPRSLPCVRAGVLGKRGSLESVATRICGEAGGRVSMNVFVRDLDLYLPNAADGRRLVVDGLLLFGGAQSALDSTSLRVARNRGTRLVVLAMKVEGSGLPPHRVSTVWLVPDSLLEFPGVFQNRRRRSSLARSRAGLCVRGSGVVIRATRPSVSGCAQMLNHMLLILSLVVIFVEKRKNSVPCESFVDQRGDCRLF